MVKVILWCLLSMICIDLSIGYLVKPPKNNIRSSISEYFDYGRSTEGKLLRLVGTNDEEAGKHIRAGWYMPKENGKDKKLSETLPKQRMFIYGMSFTNHIGKIIAKQEKQFDVKMFAGPGAPLSYTYEYYQQHRPHKKGDIVILGILASSVLRMNTLTPMTILFEGPAAHFYPRYSFDAENKLIKKEILINSLSELRQTMKNKEKWDQVKKVLEKEDSYYNPLLFNKNFSDRSTFAKMIRRAWAQKFLRETGLRYHDNKGFKNTDRLIDLSQKMVANFVEQVRSDNAIPYIILFNNLGFDDHLYLMLKPVLEQYKIPFFSSHYNFPANQLSNFITDGHFTPKVDQLIKDAVLKDIKKMNKV